MRGMKEEMFISIAYYTKPLNPQITTHEQEMEEISPACEPPSPSGHDVSFLLEEE